jgi:AcrR family transcriptional regulator
MGDPDSLCATGRPCDPRVARSRAAVLAACAGLLTDHGFAGVTIEAVAARSGVAKTTIYRHWPSRPALLVDAFRSLGCPAPPPGTGDLRRDLVTLAGGLARELDRAPWAALLPSLTAEARRDPELGALHREFMAECRAPVLAVVRAAVARGELAADVDPAIAAALVAGPLFYRRFVSLEPLDEPGLPERVVDAALEGLRAPRPPGAAGAHGDAGPQAASAPGGRDAAAAGPGG